MNILKRENIPFLRITRNIGRTSLINKIYRKTYNSILSFNHLAYSNYFGSIVDFNYSKKVTKENSIIELMIHPGFVINNQIFDIYSNDNISEQISKILKNNMLISYNQLLEKLSYIKSSMK